MPIFTTIGQSERNCQIEKFAGGGEKEKEPNVLPIIDCSIFEVNNQSYILHVSFKSVQFNPRTAMTFIMMFAVNFASMGISYCFNIKFERNISNTSIA